MALNYDDVALFLGVAREGSFSGAARALAVPVSTVSRRVAALEARLKTQLVRRTTRAVSLTEDGRAFAERCATALEEIESAAEALGAAGGRLSGTLRVTAPYFVCSDTFGHYLLQFAATHPDLVMDLRLTNGTPDLVEEGIDLSFQLGPLREGRHVARRLWPVPYVLCASRAFLASCPGWSGFTHPRQLADVPCILTPPIGVWEFELGAFSHSFTPKRLGATVDDLALGAVAVRRGLGLGYLPQGLVAEDLGRELVCLDIAGWQPRPRELYALYPAARQLSAKVRAIIDFALAARANHA